MVSLVKNTFNGFSLIILVVIIWYFQVYNRKNLEYRDSNTKENPFLQGDSSNSSCNLFSGRWVYEKKSRPLYEGRKCSFMFNDYACDKYGRKDLGYQHWQWKPHDCDLPRFNGTAFLEKIRGKKLVFVGDSLNKNQFVSLLCLIESAIHPSLSKSINITGNMRYFQATEYNATIGIYWSPFLVESNNDDLYVHHDQNRIVRIKGIEKHARHWNDADILIFDTYIWWTHPTITLLWGSFGDSDAIYKKVEMKLRRYEMALSTWSDWLEININRTKTKLFFMGLSPMHQWGEDWSVEKNCFNESEPILKQNYWGISTDRDMMGVQQSAIEKLESRGVKVQYLNITQLSDYRKDAHPSIYRKFKFQPTEEQLRNPKSYSDCLHWCLPGLPDTWNEILYSYIINS